VYPVPCCYCSCRIFYGVDVGEEGRGQVVSPPTSRVDPDQLDCDHGGPGV
jgi:hypothetical protein